jgi:eukaryotic-like serine/threonine-protein kinase
MSYQWRDLIGALLSSKYRLTEYLGDVAGNGVFATNAENGAAIVRLAPDEVAGADELFRQWSAAVRISHPSIVRTYEAGRDELDGAPFVYTVTERPDDSLAEVIRSRPLRPEEARPVVEATLGALDYLHSQGSVHTHISPDNIVAVGNHVKLSPWTIRKGTDTERVTDMTAVGQTIVEILTQHRPAESASVDFRALPSPFGQIARRCLERRLNVSEALLMLRSPHSESEPAKELAGSKFRLPMGALIAALAGVVLLVFGLRAYKARPVSPEPVPVASNTHIQRERAAPPPAIAPPPQAPAGNWVVVAAIYKDHALAAKRAEQIAQKWKYSEPEVYPPAGQGGRRYMVLLGRAESRKEAERILARARTSGMPRDTYLTKIKP